MTIGIGAKKNSSPYKCIRKILINIAANAFLCLFHSMINSPPPNAPFLTTMMRQIFGCFMHFCFVWSGILSMCTFVRFEAVKCTHLFPIVSSLKLICLYLHDIYNVVNNKTIFNPSNGSCHYKFIYRASSIVENKAMLISCELLYIH